MGIGHGQTYTVAGMKRIRIREFMQSAKALGIHCRVFDFPDLWLERRSAAAIPRLLPIVRAGRFSALFSFHPQSNVLEHSDHRAAGIITSRLWEVSNVRSFMPRYAAPILRPKLYLLTQDVPPIVPATHIVPYGDGVRKRRNRHARLHPSQFSHSADTLRSWRRRFDRLTGHVAAWYKQALPYAEAYRLIE